ncbi:MAG: hypothetical protein JW885_02880 [Deltaproteobacteria bacterium]|nr:hypothetical protein [Candidatus Zymogenaceae bacterium]
MEQIESDLLISLYQNPVAGVREFFDVELQGDIRKDDDGIILWDDYQVGSFLDWRTRRQLEWCGRGVGKSMYLGALKWAYWGVVLPYVFMAIYRTKRPMGIRFVVTGNNMDTAKQLLQYIRNFIAVSPLFAAEIDQHNDSRMLLRLKNGTEYHVRAGSDAARGLNPYSFQSGRLGKTILGMTVVLADEYAYFVDQDFYTEVVEPYLSLGMSVFHAFSTPNGKENMAYQNSVDRDFTVRAFHSAQNAYRDMRELVKIYRRLVDMGFPEVWNEEYMGIPQDAKNRTFPERLVLRAIEGFPGGVLDKDELLWTDEYIREHAEELVAKTGPLFLGGDPNKGKMERGQQSDACALAIVELQQNPFRLVLRYAAEWGNPESVKDEYREQIDLDEYTEKIIWLYKTLKIRQGGVDINPGRGIVLALSNMTPPILNLDWIDTDSSKRGREIDDIALSLMEKGQLVIPPEMILRMCFKRYGTTNDKGTGKKKNDLMKAILYAVYMAVQEGVARHAPPEVVTIDRKGGIAMPRTGRAESILRERNLTSVGLSTLTSVGKHGTNLR